jgi:hypothetical protein
MLMQFAAAHPGVIAAAAVTFGFSVVATIVSIVLAPREDARRRRWRPRDVL